MQTRFILIGYGWRADFFYRISRMLPDRFRIAAWVLRTERRAAQVQEETGIYATADLEKALEKRYARLKAGMILTLLERLPGTAEEKEQILKLLLAGDAAGDRVLPERPWNPGAHPAALPSVRKQQVSVPRPHLRDGRRAPADRRKTEGACRSVSFLRDRKILFIKLS